jgi:radical SAM protein with 4Fe4S-binding SPASM domain
MGLVMVTLTGGEPLLYGGLEELVAHAFAGGCQVRLFSNANLLETREQVEALKRAGLCYLETSIYGSCAATHDAVTLVPGSFGKTVRAIRWANESGIPVTLKTSWMKQNWKEYEPIVRLAGELGVFFRGSPGIMPRTDGSTDNLQHQLSFDELVDFYRIDHAVNQSASHYDEEESKPRKTPCGVARVSLTIGPDGAMFPCLHLRQPFGNLFEDDLKTLWTEAPLLKKLRQTTLDDIPFCRGCDLRKYCFICLGDGWQEWGDFLRPSTSTCLLARARCAADKGTDDAQR